MSARIKFITLAFVLIGSILACSGLSPVGTAQPSGDAVATVVATTLQALTPGVTLSPATDLLPK
jgi:hypothetical protein